MLAMPAKTEARRLRTQIDQLATHSVDISSPKSHTTPPSAPRRSFVVRTIRLGGGEQRRRQVGAEGEQWALQQLSSLSLISMSGNGPYRQSPSFSARSKARRCNERLRTRTL